MLGPITDSFTLLISNLYISIGLLGVVLVMAIDGSFIPLPGEIIMPFAGIMFVEGNLLHGTGFVMGVLQIGLAGAAGCVLGSMLSYTIGARGGRQLLLKGERNILISPYTVESADLFFHRWGASVTFLARLLPITRTYISLPAGIAKMPFSRFWFYTFLGSFPFCLLFTYIGTILGRNLRIFYIVAFGVTAVVLVTLVIRLFFYLQSLRDERDRRNAEAMQSEYEMQQAQAQEEWQMSQPMQAQQQWGQQQGWGQQYTDQRWD